jgi:hypothetical protein
MILTDFSQLCIANIVQHPEDFKKGVTDAATAINLVRHSTLATLLSYKRLYGRQYGQVVIATDGRNYWRRDEFEFYKWSRKQMRKDSDLDWQLIHDVTNQFKEEFMQIFPYPVIRVDEAEADDVIAVLCEFTQENELVTVGLETDIPQPTLILSSDGDFKQLHKYSNVRQWSPLLKKYVTASRDGIAFDLMEKIVKGDGGDGVPNIYSPDNHYTLNDGKPPRQKSVTAGRLADFVIKGRDACLNDDERRNFDRNKKLVDLTQIPASVSDDIVADYIAKSGRKADQQMILAYFNKHRMRQLVDNIQEF